MNKVNVILFRGYMGEIYSRGMDTLGDRLKKVEGVDYVHVGPYTAVDITTNYIKAYKDPTILVGHSFGASAAVKVAWELDKDIPAMFLFDPSQYDWMRPEFYGVQTRTIPMNVKSCTNFYQTSWLPFAIGDQRVQRESGSTYKIKNLKVEPNMHISIDDDQSLHDEVIRQVEAIINGTG